MTDDYGNYRPMLLETASLETFAGEEYRRFILDTAIVPGVRLLLNRHAARPDWPYIDTKFNPNTGADLPAESYNVVYPWFLGRGSQALAGHLKWLDRLEGLSAGEKASARDLFKRLLATMAGAIVKTVDLGGGRCPFRVNRSLEAIDQAGRRIDSDTSMTGAGDIFVAKGLIAAGPEDNIRRGVESLARAADLIRRNRVWNDQFDRRPADVGQGMRMLMQDTVPALFAASTDPALRRRVADIAAEFMAFVLDRHYDPATGVFAENIDAETGLRKSYLDPGHANEFVGLGLAAVERMRAARPDPARKALLDRACREMPRLLIKSTELGWNHAHRGLHKAVDTQSGQVIDDDLPWWNLPETMRAAARAFTVTADEPIRRRCLELIRMCHNAYFEKYPNPANMLFPLQTISGSTGKVIDKAPAVPEGDPLYHTNLALLDMLEVLERL